MTDKAILDDIHTAFDTDDLPSYARLVANDVSDELACEHCDDAITELVAVQLSLDSTFAPDSCFVHLACLTASPIAHVSDS